MTRYCVAGGAGFIGSHLVLTLLRDEPDAQVVVFDNFSSGQRWHLAPAARDPRLTVVEGELSDARSLTRALKGCEVVYHFASNPDISKAATEPDIDFWEGTALTNGVLEAMRATGARSIIYASGSGVYGDTGTRRTREDHAPLLPVSTYGASKLAGESLICAYTHLFDLRGIAFRFANVVGPRQTHGVAYDFIRKLRRNPAELEVLGDGTQCKPYIHVEDVIAGIRLLQAKAPAGFSYFNLAPQDALTVTAIAELVVRAMGLGPVRYRYTGGSRGWKGDVPQVRMDTAKLRRLGWRNRWNSRQAMERAIQALLAEPQRAAAGRKGKQP